MDELAPLVGKMYRRDRPECYVRDVVLDGVVPEGYFLVALKREEWVVYVEDGREWGIAP